jgi:hypothetical protein
MKRRMRLNGIPLSDEFGTFAGFMDHVGPKPHPTYTLNRENNDNPAYVPGHVSWASKPDQSNNRRNTIRLSYTGSILPQFSGQTKPLAEWARLRGFNQPVMRQRRMRGWTDNENIEGARSADVKSFAEMSAAELVAYRPWTKENAEKNESAYLNDRLAGESRMQYRERLLGLEAAYKWQALLKVAEKKIGDLTFEKILSYRHPEFCLRPYRDVSQETFQWQFETWRQIATRWLSARNDLKRWQVALQSRERITALPKRSKQADVETLRAVQHADLNGQSASSLLNDIEDDD